MYEADVATMQHLPLLLITKLGSSVLNRFFPNFHESPKHYS